MTQSNTLATTVHAQLKRDILSGKIEPGSKVRVASVVDAYGAGASPVREALNRLSSEGLLEQRDQRGFFAVGISADSLRELTRTRCLVEEVALRESMRDRTQEWEEGIVLAVHRLDRVAMTPEDTGEVRVGQWELAHRQFHQALIGNCNSSWLLSFCDSLADQADRYRKIARAEARATREVAAEHRAIAELVLAGDIPAATEALCRHYRLTMDICLAVIDRR